MSKANLRISVFHECLTYGILITLFYFLATWHFGINLADEGFYWYGAQRTLVGEVPILDFMAYDPGRYYIAATVMAMLGSDGIWAARFAAYLVLVLLVTIGIYFANLSFNGNRVERIVYSSIVAALLCIWTYPYFRSFDFLAGALLVLAVSLFLRQRTSKSWFLAGFLVGLVAVLGRNHGVYGIVGHAVALGIIYLDREGMKPAVASYFYWIAGVVVGYLPIILLIVLVDGFPQAFFEGIKSLIESGSTNIALPVPWPWTIDLNELGLSWSAIYFVEGLFFVCLVAFPILGLTFLIIKRVMGKPINPDTAASSIFLASVCLSLPYAHYALSRPDVEHLAPSMLPMIFGVLSLPFITNAKPRLLTGIFLLAFCTFVMVGAQPALRHYILQEKVETYTIGPDELLIPVDQSHSIRRLDDLIKSELLNGGSFLALPNFPTLHAIHHSKMQVWQIYSLHPRPKTFELREISRIEKMKPSLVILSNHALDNNETYRYSNMRPVTYQWLNDHYRKEHLGNYEIYRLN